MTETAAPRRRPSSVLICVAPGETSCCRESFARPRQGVDRKHPDIDVWAVAADVCTSSFVRVNFAGRKAAIGLAWKQHQAVAHLTSFRHPDSDMDISTTSTDTLAQGVLERVFLRNPKGSHSLSNAV